MTILRITPVEMAAGGLAFAECGLAVLVLRLAPARTPVHFGLNGAPDRWSTPVGAAAWLLCSSAAVLLLVAALGVSARRRWADAARRRGLSVAQGLVAVVGAGVAVIMTVAYLQPGNAAAGGFAPLLGVSLILLAVGLFLGRVPPNALVGVRTPWSLSSRLSWDKANRLAGRLLAAAGGVGLVAAAVLPLGAAMPILLAAVLTAAVLPVVESWRVWRTDPAKRPI